MDKKITGLIKSNIVLFCAVDTIFPGRVVSHLQLIDAGNYQIRPEGQYPLDLYFFNLYIGARALQAKIARANDSSHSSCEQTTERK